MSSEAATIETGETDCRPSGNISITDLDVLLGERLRDGDCDCGVTKARSDLLDGQ